MSKASEDFPEPDKAGDHDELVARQVDADVLEIVGAGAANLDLLHGQARFLARVNGNRGV